MTPFSASVALGYCIGVQYASLSGGGAETLDYPANDPTNAVEQKWWSDHPREKQSNVRCTPTPSVIYECLGDEVKPVANPASRDNDPQPLPAVELHPFFAFFRFFCFAFLARGWRGLTSACGSGFVASIRLSTSSAFIDRVCHE